VEDLSRWVEIKSPAFRKVAEKFDRLVDTNSHSREEDYDDEPESGSVRSRNR